VILSSGIGFSVPIEDRLGTSPPQTLPREII
jgi:hypothetical protein